VTEVRRETDSLGVVGVPADKLWGAQTQRSLQHFNIGQELIPREMITAYAILKRAAAAANHAGGRLNDRAYELITLGCANFRKFLVEGARPNRKKIAEYVEHSLMLVTALAPVIGYDKASAIAHHAIEHDLTLKEAALQLGYVDSATFDRVVDPAKMVKPYVATQTA
jgi:fumarate hydratase class II